MTAASHPAQNLAAIPAMAVAAAVTSSIKIGSRVMCVDYHQPVVLAKSLSTIDVLSDGRLEAGLGAGWITSEYEAMGIPMDRAGIRIDRMIEVRRAWCVPSSPASRPGPSRASMSPSPTWPPMPAAVQDGRPEDHDRWRLAPGVADRRSSWPTSCRSTSTTRPARSGPTASDQGPRPEPPTRSPGSTRARAERTESGSADGGGAEPPETGDRGLLHHRHPRRGRGRHQGEDGGRLRVCRATSLAAYPTCPRRLGRRDLRDAASSGANDLRHQLHHRRRRHHGATSPRWSSEAGNGT